MQLRLILIALSTAIAGAVMAAEPPPIQAIQDNSFLIEEAYNQEDRVVQHIFTFARDRHTGEYVATFTQEWPAGGLKHQFSYTGAMQRLDGRRSADDALLNYRYQLLGTGDSRLAIAPRASLVVPTDRTRGYGYDVNVPVSVMVNDRLVTHWNAGATGVPSSHEPAVFSAGGSVIAAASSNVHLMVEARWTRSSLEKTFTISPGARFAINLGKLQVVPGVAFPITRDSRGVYGYLSFEHPF